jgi:hypothetical protein
MPTYNELKELFFKECTYKLENQYTDTYRQFSIPPDDVFDWFIKNVLSENINGYISVDKALEILNTNAVTCMNLTDEDKVRSAQDIINETYEDLISIFQKYKKLK